MSSPSLHTTRRILANTAALTAAKTIADLAIFFYLAYFARVFGPSVLGKYSFAMSVGGLISILISLGFHTVMLRDAARHPASEFKFAGNLFLVECVLATLVTGLLFAVAAALNLDDDGRMIVLLIGGYHILSRLCGLFEVRFRIHEEMYYSALFLIAEKLLILALGVCAILVLKDPVATLAVYPIAAAATLLLISTVTTRRYGSPDFTLDLPFIKNALISTLPFIALIVLGQASDRGGVILLAFLADDHSVGIFAAADRLIASVIAGIVMFGTALFPVMARLQVQSRDEMTRVYNGALRVLSIVILPLATLLFLFSEEIISLLFGPSFSASANVLRVLSLSLPSLALNQMSGVLLMATLKHDDLIRLSALALIALLTLSLLLIPAFGSLGLAIARLFSSLFTALLIYRLIAKYQLTLLAMRSAMAALLACTMTGVVFFLLVHDRSIWIAAPSTLAVLLCAMFILGAVQRNDMVYLKSIFVHEDKGSSSGGDPSRQNQEH